MDKQKLEKTVREHGDSYIHYKSPVSGKIKYNVCTLDFDNKYIQNKKCRVKPKDDEVLMFCWDTDAFRLMKHDLVMYCVPLARELRND